MPLINFEFVTITRALDSVLMTVGLPIHTTTAHHPELNGRAEEHIKIAKAIL